MQFRLNVDMEIPHGDSPVVAHTPVRMQILYQSGKWKALCEDPPVSTLVCDSLEEVLIHAAKEAAAELQFVQECARPDDL